MTKHKEAQLRAKMEECEEITFELSEEDLTAISGGAAQLLVTPGVGFAIRNHGFAIRNHTLQ